MKTLVLSDLHVEFTGFEPMPEAVAAADVVVLAGDIHKEDQGLRWARERFPSKEIVYVAGNHEFYGGVWNWTLDEMRETARELGIHFLEDDSATIGELRFLGCTLWTDFEYFGAQRRDEAMKAVERGLNDYRQIAPPVPRYDPEAPPAPSQSLTAQMTLQRHQASRAWLQTQLSQGDPARTVVVTHHYPHRDSTAPQYADDRLTPGFGSQLPLSMLLGAGLWIHGHTHSSCDYRLGDSRRSVRVVCNPRGYPMGWWSGEFENQAFNPALLLQQDASGGWRRVEERHDEP